MPLSISRRAVEMKRKGIVKGQSIEFDEPLGLPEGQAVEVEVSLAKAVDLERYGIRPLPSRGYVVTNEMVRQWREDLGV